jgi:hypothetical protein
MDTPLEEPPRELETETETETKAPEGAGLTVSRILAWAVMHRAETGRWPTRLSGRLPGDNGYQTWHAIDLALCLGLRGLPGGQSLAGLLYEENAQLAAMWQHYARVREQKQPGGETPRRPAGSAPRRPLSIAQILAWADVHHEATGRWPNSHSGPVAGVPGESWTGIAKALVVGRRGLPAGMPLRRLLLEHRGAQVENGSPKLTIERILQWADAHHAAHGQWPIINAGPVPGVGRLSWSSIDRSLRYGGHGLPGGTSLPRLLREKRGLSRPSRARKRSRLSVDQILSWADAHYAARGEWPRVASGSVVSASGECWQRIDLCLRYGNRGLPGGSSLRRLLDEHRPVPRRVLSLEMILAWTRAHHAATGRWPHASSGAVAGVSDETWSRIDAALRKGCRGLPGGSSLSQLLRTTFFPDRKRGWRTLTLEHVRAWAEAHYAATGRWPRTTSGVVQAAPAEKWRNLQQALRKGLRGLPPGHSLAELFASRQALTPGPAPGRQNQM